MGFVRDHINQITKTKNPDYFKNLSEEGKKSFNGWLIVKYLSYSFDLVPIISKFPSNIYTLPPGVLYQFLIENIPEGDYTFKVIKGRKGKTKTDKKLEDLLCNYYQCSKKDSQEYVEILNEIGELENTKEWLSSLFGKN